MNKLKPLLLLFLVGILLAGCSTLQTVSDYDKGTDFKPYKSFSFYDKGLERLRLNDLDKRRLMAAVETTLNQKEFTKSDNPDFLVNLVVVARERVDHYGPGFYGGWGFGWGWPFWGGGRNYVNEYKEGTIIIDFLDPVKKSLFWHGKGAGFNLDSYHKRTERLQKGVDEILAQYPPDTTK